MHHHAAYHPLESFLLLDILDSVWVSCTFLGKDQTLMARSHCCLRPFLLQNTHIKLKLFCWRSSSKSFNILTNTFLLAPQGAHNTLKYCMWALPRGGMYCISTLLQGGMYWVVHSRRPRDFPRPERCPEGKASWFEAVYSHSLIIDPSLGMYQEIHPWRASSTYSVKINISLLMMREW